MMSLKVIEVLAESTKSWEHATQTAVEDAAKNIRNITSVHVQHFSAVVDEDKVTKYRVNVKLTFGVDR